MTINSPAIDGPESTHMTRYTWFKRLVHYSQRQGLLDLESRGQTVRAKFGPKGKIDILPRDRPISDQEASRAQAHCHQEGQRTQ